MAQVIFTSLCVVGCGLMSGCGCGDTAAVRHLTVFQFRGVHTSQAFDVEAPDGVIVSRSERKDGCGNPITDLRITADQPVKIVIVPTTQR